MAVANVTGLPPISTLTSQETQLEYLCRNTQACVLRPYCFFVSWQGVLTLAYRWGWTAATERSQVCSVSL